MESYVSIRAREKKGDGTRGGAARKKPSRGNEYRREEKIRHDLPGSTRDYWVESIHERERVHEEMDQTAGSPHRFYPWHSSCHTASLLRFPLFCYVFELSQRTRVACSSRESYSTVLAGAAHPLSFSSIQWASDRWGEGGREEGEIIGNDDTNVDKLFC